MSDSVQALDPRSVTRREFTLEAALAILAGCVIAITETGCGGGYSDPGPSPMPVGDVTGTISANHGHSATISSAQITAGNAITLDIRSQADHPHTVAVSQANLATLNGRQSVTITSSTDASHSHSVTFTPA
jgi:hypothetical protein